MILAFVCFPSTVPYSLYWSGNTPNNYVNGRANNSVLCVWEAGTFSITATRVKEVNIPSISNPPGQHDRFDGRLRSVSICLKYIDGTTIETVKLIGAGVLASNIIRGPGGSLLKSHSPNMSIRTGSFWEYEQSQINNLSCIGNSKYLPGCFNSTDRPDNSSLTLSFPVGLASIPHGRFGAGPISIVPTRFKSGWNDFPDYSSNHQSFFLLLLRMFLCS